MLKQLFVTVGIIVSSFLMERFYADLCNGSESSLVNTSIYVFACVMSFFAASTLAWSARDMESPRWFNRHTWKPYFRTLIGMCSQILTVLTFVWLQGSKISIGFLVFTAVTVAITAFFLAAVLFAPKEKPSGQSPNNA
jgi:Na+/melibiose symporter-like transporter